MVKTRSEITGVIKRYTEELSKLGIRTNRTILFGSFAKGMPQEGSDIDLIVVSDDFERMNLRERLEILGIAAARIMEPIEAYGCTSQEIDGKERSDFLEEALTAGEEIV